ncbi:hypothetical protein [[Clostridium] polysaccharolyticum]|uniref:Uncharacterized protein n=1 Tax=[Clostridium] polysaccharolyticum TaxID=29364 RepID=A0A1H9ZQ79_9FIRM|nr:hypothetical protein [[Clostridium] polysaccharolyticum]SES83499.1 hypothetical protein SAMN04487772_10438 [[Clostridium] polysaccharolyticum]
MINGIRIWLVGSSSVTGKLEVLAGVVVFAAIVYAIFPRLAEKKLREYHKQCEIEDEPEGENCNREKQDTAKEMGKEQNET